MPRIAAVRFTLQRPSMEIRGRPEADIAPYNSIAREMLHRYATKQASHRSWLAICGVALVICFQLVACSRSNARGDVTLSISEATLTRLRALRAESKFVDLPGAPAARERQRLEPLMNDLLDRLITGLPTHPSKRWLLEAMEPSVSHFYLEDTEARDRCIDYLERILQIVGTKGSDGAFAKYMIDF